MTSERTPAEIAKALTKPQAMVLRAVCDGVVEGYLWDEVRPAVSARGIRRVLNGLEAKGLVRFVAWLDDERGYELEPTGLGAFVNAIGRGADQRVG